MAVSSPPRQRAQNRSRDEVAKRLKPMLTDEPQSAITLAERLGLAKPAGGFNNELVLDACNVLFARREARRIPNTAGSPQGGWVRWDSPIKFEDVTPAKQFKWPFAAVSWIPVEKIGVDPNFQRPLTGFAGKIEADFDPEQFGVLTLSDRGAKFERENGWRYSAVDGQTRWVAGSNIGAGKVPSIVYTNLTPEEEAALFWRLQKNRRGILSAHIFKARLASKDAEAVAVAKLLKQHGYEIGDGQGQIRSPVAVEQCYKRDPDLLEDTLIIFKEAWSDIVPEAKHIKGLHHFLRHFPVDGDDLLEVDIERMIRRLEVNRPTDIEKKLLSVRDLHRGSTDKLMALAFQSAYQGRGSR